MKQAQGLFETSCERKIDALGLKDLVGGSAGDRRPHHLPASVAKRDTLVIIMNIEAITVVPIAA